MVNKTKISEVAKLWREDKKKYVKLSTYTAYVLLLDNHIIPYFGGKEEITEQDTQAYVLSKIEAGLSIKTIKDIIIVLKMILKFGAKNNMLEYHQIDILYPIQPKVEIEVLTRDNQKKLMDYLKENFTFKNLGILICLSAGLRIGEVCALTWNDIDTEESILKVNHTIQRIYHTEGEKKYTELVIGEPKTQQSKREIPLSADLVKLLKPLKKIVNNEFFILTNEAKPTEPRTYRNYYKNILKKLNIPDIKFHGLRHSFATRCVETPGVDYKTVSVILGHSNITTTLNLYVHPNKEQKKKCIDKMLRNL